MRIYRNREEKQDLQETDRFESEREEATQDKKACSFGKVGTKIEGLGEEGRSIWMVSTGTVSRLPPLRRWLPTSMTSSSRATCACAAASWG